MVNIYHIFTIFSYFDIILLQQFITTSKYVENKVSKISQLCLFLQVRNVRIDEIMKRIKNYIRGDLI